MKKDLQVYQENKKSIGRFFKSFKYAFQGMRYAFYHEKNLIVMFVIAIITITLGIVLKISYGEGLVIVLLIGMVMALEMVNSAIEVVVDMHDKNQRSEKGKIAKDCACSAVGLMSIIALVVGLMIFIPKIIALF